MLWETATNALLKEMGLENAVLLREKTKNVIVDKENDDFSAEF